jgi:hypothetical protein
MYNVILIIIFILLNIPLLILVPVQNRRLKRVSNLYRVDVISLILMGCSIYMIYRVSIILFDLPPDPHLLLIIGYGIEYLLLSTYWLVRIWNANSKSSINNKREEKE